MDTHVKIAALLSKTESKCSEFYLFFNSYSRFSITGPQISRVFISPRLHHD